jgi:hypothetical protein
VVDRLGNDAVRQVRDEFGAARVQKFEVEVADPLEQPLARTEQDGRDMQP